MGRTYSFEPSRAQQPAQTYKGSGARLGNEEDKLAFTEEVAEEKAALAQPSTRYGQAHAETVKRYRSKAQTRKRAPAKAAAPSAKASAAKKVKPPRRSAETQRAAAPQRVVTRAPARKAEPEVESKAPARKKVAPPPTRGMGALGRKVVARAAAAARKTVASAVKTAKKATSRKPTKKR